MKTCWSTWLRSLPAAVLALTVGCSTNSVPNTVAQVPEARTDLIINGQPATPGEWPWMVAILDARTSNNYQAQLCGGTLIESNYVLTAAHCLVNVFRGGVAFPTDVDVLVGTTLLSTGGARLDVAEVIVNSDYNAITSDTDIALLRLATPAIGIPTVDVARPVDGLFVGAEAFALGWGNTVFPAFGSRFPNALQEVDVTVQSNASCNSSYFGGITENMVCANKFLKDACQGDSGGPLVVRSGLNTTQIGITSFGIGCGRFRFPGVYTRVSQFANWIDANTR